MTTTSLATEVAAAREHLAAVLAEIVENPPALERHGSAARKCPAGTVVIFQTSFATVARATTSSGWPIGRAEANTPEEAARVLLRILKREASE